MVKFLAASFGVQSVAEVFHVLERSLTGFLFGSQTDSLLGPAFSLSPLPDGLSRPLPDVMAQCFAGCDARSQNEVPDVLKAAQGCHVLVALFWGHVDAFFTKQCSGRLCHGEELQRYTRLLDAA